MIPYEWFERAAERIAPHVVETPLTWDDQRRLYLKWENHQVTGSFKARGALNKVLALDNWEREAGLVAASAGNHGQGVALAGSLTGAQVEVFVPAHAAPSKVEGMRSLGAEVHFVEGGYGEAESAAQRHAEDEHKVFISPYNDAQVIAGQGTLFTETLGQLTSMMEMTTGTEADVPRIANWVVPTGGGGLISSGGVVLTRLGRPAKLIGVQPAASAFTYSLFHSHTQEGVRDGPTLADGLSGAVDQDSVTIPMLRQFVSDVIVVSEESIASAIAFAWKTYHERIEGSGAVGLAAILDAQVEARPCVVIITGGNIEDQVFEAVIGKHASESWN
jgi:threonine dehydratase